MQVKPFSTSTMYLKGNGNESRVTYDFSILPYGEYHEFFNALPNLLYKKVRSICFTTDFYYSYKADGRHSKLRENLIKDSIFYQKPNYIQYLTKIIRNVLGKSKSLISIEFLNIKIPERYQKSIFHAIGRSQTITKVTINGVNLTNDGLDEFLQSINPYQIVSIRINNSQLTQGSFSLFYDFLFQRPRNNKVVRTVTEIELGDKCFSDRDRAELQKMILKSSMEDDWDEKKQWYNDEAPDTNVPEVSQSESIVEEVNIISPAKVRAFPREENESVHSSKSDTSKSTKSDTSKSTKSDASKSEQSESEKESEHNSSKVESDVNIESEKEKEINEEESTKDYDYSEHKQEPEEVQEQEQENQKTDEMQLYSDTKSSSTTTDSYVEEPKPERPATPISADIPGAEDYTEEEEAATSVTDVIVEYDEHYSLVTLTETEKDSSVSAKEPAKESGSDHSMQSLRAEKKIEEAKKEESSSYEYYSSDDDQKDDQKNDKKDDHKVSDSETSYTYSEAEVPSKPTEPAKAEKQNDSSYYYSDEDIKNPQMAEEQKGNEGAKKASDSEYYSESSHKAPTPQKSSSSSHAKKGSDKSYSYEYYSDDPGVSPGASVAKDDDSLALKQHANTEPIFDAADVAEAPVVQAPPPADSSDESPFLMTYVSNTRTESETNSDNN